MPKPQLVQTDTSMNSTHIKELLYNTNATLEAEGNTQGGDYTAYTDKLAAQATNDQTAAVGAAIAKVEAPLPPFTVHSESLRGELTAKSESLKKMAADIEDRIDARRIELTAELARAQAHADHDIRALEAEGTDVMRSYEMLKRAMAEPD